MVIGRRYRTPGQIMGLAVIACFAYAALLFMQQQVFFKTAMETEATVARAGGALFGNSQIVQVDYTLKGITPVSARIRAHFSRAEGQTIRIAYNPKHPSEARLAEPLDVYLGSISAFVLGCAVLAADIVRRKRKRRILASAPEYRTPVTRSLQIEYPDPVTGERRVAYSEDELPPNMRARLSAARAQAAVEGVHEIRKRMFVFTDASGRSHTYQSLDEVPHGLRRKVEQEMRGPDDH